MIDNALLPKLNLRRAPAGYAIHWPDNANIHHMTLGKHPQHAKAMIHEHADGSVTTQTFGDVDRAATNLAAHLRGLGYGKGSKIALHTGNHPDTAIAHMAVCKLGAVAVTLSQLYGPDTLSHALNDCRAPVILTAPGARDALTNAPHLHHILSRDPAPGQHDLAAAMATDCADFAPDFGVADDPALLMYTSGSTGMPKGIIHAHRILAAYTPSINLFFNLSMDDSDAVFYSPSDWAWVGGLLDMLFPAWMAGRPIATTEARFNADQSYGFMARHAVTHTFLAPTAIKRLAQATPPPLALRVICTGGEALAAETLRWAERDLGVVVNEFYGMTEVNHLIGNCAALYPRKPGSMGRAYPGHDVRLVDGDGHQVGDDEPGEIVTRDDSPTRYVGYLNAPEKEAEMQLGPWLRTRDLAVRDGDGYFWYKGRSDDLIKSSGFRIGPAEVEECLLAHPAVAECAVIAKPDADRGHIVKAVIKLAAGATPDPALIATLQDHVRTRLAPYKAPREVTFVAGFAMTSSGKINRRALREAET